MATAAKVLYAHIVKEPGYCGGKAVLDSTRVRVMNVVFLHKEGKTPERILEVYPGLSLAQVHAALVYYYDHVQEIEAELKRDEDAASHFGQEQADAIARRHGQ